MDPRDAAFIAPPVTIAGRTLRDFTAGTLTLCRALGLSLITGEGDAPKTQGEQHNQLLTLLFLQCEELPKVLQAVKVFRTDPQAFLDDYLLPFALTIPVGELGSIFAELEKTFVAVTASEFDVAPGKGPENPNS